MKRDFRKSEIPDLNKNFGNYRSGANLLIHYKFNNLSNGSTSLVNSAKDKRIGSLQYQTVASLPLSVVKEAPYIKRADLKSVSLQYDHRQNFRLAYDASSTNLRSNQIPITYSFWFRFPDLSTGPDSSQVIFANTLPNTTTTVSYFYWDISTQKFYFAINGTRTYGASTNNVSLVVPTYDISTINQSKKGPGTKAIKDGSWIHATVKINPKISDIAHKTGSSITIGDYIQVFINGHNFTNSSGVTGGNVGSGAAMDGYFLANSANTDLLLGKGHGDSSGVGWYSSVQLHEFAVWSKSLADSEILSIYESSVMEQRSGVLTLPPKVRIRNYDTNKITNPINTNILNDRRTIKNNSFFDDANIRIFGRRFSNYSAQIPMVNYNQTSGGDIDNPGTPHHLITASVASPSLAPTIYLTSSLGHSWASSSVGAVSYISFATGSRYWEEADINYADPVSLMGRRFRIHDKVWDGRYEVAPYGRGYSYEFSSQNHPAPIEPFKDGEVVQHQFDKIWKKDSKIGPRWMTDFPSSSRQNRAIIPIEAQLDNTTTVRRFDNQNGQDPNKGLTKSQCGFHYFNWKNSEWTQAARVIPIDESGIRGPSSYSFRLVSQYYNRWSWITGSKNIPSWPYDMGGNPFPGTVYRKCTPPIAGFSEIPRQFFPGPATMNQLGRNTPMARERWTAMEETANYAGHPMIQYGAPQAQRYFGAKDLRLNLKDFIAHPFLLEKVVLEVPNVKATRTYSDRNAWPATAYPQDNYVFMLYRQATVGKNIQDQLSGSDRYLICSGVFAAYARDAWDTDSWFPYGSFPQNPLYGYGPFQDLQYGPGAPRRGITWSQIHEGKTGNSGIVFQPTNDPAATAEFINVEGTVNYISNGRFDVTKLTVPHHYPGTGQPVASQSAFTVDTGFRDITLVMTPTIMPKKRYGQFFEHCQVQRVVSGSYMDIRMDSGTGNDGVTTLQPASVHDEPSYTTAINYQFSNYVGVSKQNPNTDVIMASTDVYSKRNEAMAGVVEPDYSREHPVNCSWLGGSTFAPGNLRKSSMVTGFIDGYFYKDGPAAGSKRGWMDNRGTIGADVSMTPLGLVHTASEEFVKFGGQPWTQTAATYPNSFMEISQINEDATRRYFAAERIDPRHRNNSMPGAASPYQEIHSEPRANWGIYPAIGGQTGPTAVSGAAYWSAYDDPSENAQRDTGYVLFPEDDLILGIDAAIAMPQHLASGSLSSLTGSYLTLDPATIRITLIGSYFRKGNPVHNHSDQQLLNNNASYAIGLDYVTDQLDIATVENSGGIYTSRYVTGSMTSDIFKRPVPASSDGFRRIIATAISGNLGDTYSFRRNVTLYETGSVFYDSMMPNVKKLWRNYGPDELGYEEDSSGTEIPHGPDGDISTSYKIVSFGLASRKEMEATEGPFNASKKHSATLAKTYNENWHRSYPFEPKYHRSIRTADGWDAVVPDRFLRSSVGEGMSLTDLSTGYGRVFVAASPGGATGSFRPESHVGILIGGPKHVEGMKAPGGIIFSHQVKNHKWWYRAEDPELHLRFLYGFGDKNQVVDVKKMKSGSLSLLSSGRKYLSGYDDATLAGTDFYNTLTVATKPRGWKYGVQNPVPVSNNAVFRSNRFGQFRDMLEQRKFGVMYDSESGRLDIDSYPVVAAFRVPEYEDPTTYTPVESPEETQSSNLSIHATSSLPYFEDRLYPFGRNRGEPVDGIVLVPVP